MWDVLLFDGNRVMLFQTALALLDLYGTDNYIGFVFYMIIFKGGLSWIFLLTVS